MDGFVYDYKILKICPEATPTGTEWEAKVFQRIIRWQISWLALVPWTEPTLVKDGKF